MKRKPAVPLTEEQSALAAAYVPLAKVIAGECSFSCPRLREEIFSDAFLRLVQCAGRWEARLGLPFDMFVSQQIPLGVMDAFDRERPAGLRKSSLRWAASFRGERRRVSRVPFRHDGRHGEPQDRGGGASLDESEAFETLVAWLPARNRAVMRAIYSDGLSQTETAARLGKGKSWISFLHAESLKILRERLAPAA